MRTQALARELNIERVDLEALDQFLMSDRSPPDSMMLSDLDGFLTGIAIGPELIQPSEWLPLIWGGEAPEFADLDEANAILGSLMARYNEILHEVDDDAFGPIFWIDRDGTVIPMDWAEGFLQAIMLRADAWEVLFSRHGELLLPILSLCGDSNGDSLLGLPPEAEDHNMEQAADLIPYCVTKIADFWRRNRPKRISMSPRPGARREPGRPVAKIGRNDPCPCRSGRKFKKCCGQAN